MNPWFALAYGVLITGLVTVELIGVRRHNKNQQDKDTITEGWVLIDRRLNGFARWGWRVAWIGFLGWLILHFTSGGKM
jgi:hypothetical protein